MIDTNKARLDSVRIEVRATAPDGERFTYLMTFEGNSSSDIEVVTDPHVDDWIEPLSAYVVPRRTGLTDFAMKLRNVQIGES